MLRKEWWLSLRKTRSWSVFEEVSEIQNWRSLKKNQLTSIPQKWVCDRVSDVPFTLKHLLQIVRRKDCQVVADKAWGQNSPMISGHVPNFVIQKKARLWLNCKCCIGQWILWQVVGTQYSIPQGNVWQRRTWYRSKNGGQLCTELAAYVEKQATPQKEQFLQLKTSNVGIPQWLNNICPVRKDGLHPKSNLIVALDEPHGSFSAIRILVKQIEFPAIFLVQSNCRIESLFWRDSSLLTYSKYWMVQFGSYPNNITFTECIKKGLTSASLTTAIKRQLSFKQCIALCNSLSSKAINFKVKNIAYSI